MASNCPEALRGVAAVRRRGKQTQGCDYQLSPCLDMQGDIPPRGTKNQQYRRERTLVTEPRRALDIKASKRCLMRNSTAGALMAKARVTTPARKSATEEQARTEGGPSAQAVIGSGTLCTLPPTDSLHLITNSLVLAVLVLQPSVVNGDSIKTPTIAFHRRKYMFGS